MEYCIIDLDDSWVGAQTPEVLRLTIKEEYIVLRKNKENIPQSLHAAMNKSETGAAYCEKDDQFFPIFEPYLQTGFDPSVIAIKKELFTNGLVDLYNLFQTLVNIYNVSVVRRA